MDADLRVITSRPWAVEPTHGAAFVQALADCIQARAAGATAPQKQVVREPSRSGSVATLSMVGPMLHKPAAWLAEWGIEHVDTIALTEQVKAAAADPSVQSIVINADTPGGMVGGVPELAAAISGAGKPVEVRVDGMLASAGVWAASGASRITATTSSEVGSIGVYTVRVDRSRALDEAGIKIHLVSSGGVKGGGADGRVTDAMLAEDARIVGQLRDAFVSDLSAGRKRDLASRATGQVWLAHEAQRIGLVDAVIGANNTGSTMTLAPLAALAKQHPAKATEILELAAAGKTDAEISAHIVEAARQDEVAALKADADKARADLKAEQDKSAALASEIAALKAKLSDAEKARGTIAALKAGAPKDPGHDDTATKSKTRAELDAMPESDRRAFFNSGGIVVG